MKHLHTFLVAVSAISISAFTFAGHHEKGEAMEAAEDAMETVEAAQDAMGEMEPAQDAMQEMEAAEDAMEEMGAAVEQITEETPKLMEY